MSAPSGGPGGGDAGSRRRLEEEIYRSLDAAFADEPTIAEAPHLREAIESYLRRPARLMRPRVLLAAAEAYLPQPEATYRRSGEAIYALAAATELLHVFALMHDDQLDGNPRPGVYPAQDRGTLLLAGDLLHTRAMALIEECVAEFGLPREISRRVTSVSEKTIAGQAMDVHLLNEGPPPHRDRLYRLYDLKTGYYSFVAPLVVGALASAPETSPTEIDTLEELGLRLGRAYQLRDDAADTAALLDQSDDATAGSRIGTATPRPWEFNLLVALLTEIGSEEVGRALVERLREEGAPGPELRERLAGVRISLEVEPWILGLVDEAERWLQRLSLNSERRGFLLSRLLEIVEL